MDEIAVSNPRGKSISAHAREKDKRPGGSVRVLRSIVTWLLARRDAAALRH
jgi:hypothetical protein